MINRSNYDKITCKYHVYNNTGNNWINDQSAPPQPPPTHLSHPLIHSSSLPHSAPFHPPTYDPLINISVIRLPHAPAQRHRHTWPHTSLVTLCQPEYLQRSTVILEHDSSIMYIYIYICVCVCVFVCLLICLRVCLCVCLCVA